MSSGASRVRTISGSSAGSAFGHPAGSGEEVIHAQNAVLEQITEAPRGDEGNGVPGFDVLAEQQHRQCGVTLAQQACCACPVVGHGGWHPDVDHGQVRDVTVDRVEKRVGISDGGDDVMPGLDEQPLQALTNSAESSAITTRTAAPRGWWCPHPRDCRSKDCRRVPRHGRGPRSDRTPAAPPTPLSRFVTAREWAPLRTWTSRQGCMRVLVGVGRTFGNDEVAGRGKGLEQVDGGDLELDGDRAGGQEVPERRA